MQSISRITSHYFALATENIDTDQIIPARFLKMTDKEGLGPLAFHDRRYTADGLPDPDFPLNARCAGGAEILVAGHNFGCGSSREHAAWALLSAGIRGVVSSGFGDIFRNNALKNGLVPVQVSPEALRQLMSAWDRARAGNAERTPVLTIDVASQTLTSDCATPATVTFPFDPFAKHCLLLGIDQLEFLLSAAEDIGAYEELSTLRSIGGASAAEDAASGEWPAQWTGTSGAEFGE